MSLKHRWVILALVCASTAAAQMTNYQGPGILSRGAGDVGAHAGQQVNIRLSAAVSGFVDNGLLPLGVGSDGTIPDFKNMYGVEARLTAYGTHQYRRAQLGLDYEGTYRYYTDKSSFSGSDQALSLGYTIQKSRRVVIDMRGTAGEFTYGNNGFNGFATESFDPSTSLLFDNRSVFVQGSMDFTYLKSARTSFQAGGYGFKVDRRAKALVGVNGYSLRGSINHRASRQTTYGVTFDHTHYDFPRAFGEADINDYQLYIARSLGKNWTINLSGGVYQTEVQGLQTVAIDPAVAAILGVYTGVQTFYRKNTFPSGKITLTRRFKTAIATLEYGRLVIPGNGVYLTSRNEQALGTISYTGVRKWSFSASAGYGTLSGVGQDIRPYKNVTGGAGITYALTSAFHLIARYDARQQEIDIANGFSRIGYRASLGIAFSPGDVPLSLW